MCLTLKIFSCLSFYMIVSIPEQYQLVNITLKMSTFYHTQKDFRYENYLNLGTNWYFLLFITLKEFCFWKLFLNLFLKRTNFLKNLSSWALGTASIKKILHHPKHNSIFENITNNLTFSIETNVPIWDVMIDRERSFDKKLIFRFGLTVLILDKMSTHGRKYEKSSF